MRQIELVLASASPRREELLLQIGFRPVIMPSEIEEKVTSKDPAQVVMELSRQKAEEVAGRLEVAGRPVEEAAGRLAGNSRNQSVETSKTGAQRESLTVVVGSDTVVAAEGKILGKPKSEEEAFEMLSLLEGKSHQVFTGVTLIGGGKESTFYEETDVFVYPMEADEIRAYIGCGESMDKAGAYGIQGRFAAYIKGIRGSYTNVMGLPAGRVYQEIKNLVEVRDKND